MTEEKKEVRSTGVVLYQTEDGKARLEVRVEEETVWLSQGQMAELYQTTKQNVSLHINNIYEEGELTPGATVKEYLTVQNEGNRNVSRQIDHYNLEMIIAVGVCAQKKLHRKTHEKAQEQCGKTTRN